ncbi:unnamed protein product [Clonostachys byssicola]|uniref:Uncharacterized protein n=1 Tax=Clonostachys byssicola TaxID=160290 RepID=A0A9N9Y986_9HYPO|nr:unnamed protein product [Clonostachys byssicola]
MTRRSWKNPTRKPRMARGEFSETKRLHDPTDKSRNGNGDKSGLSALAISNGTGEKGTGHSSRLHRRDKVA